MSGIAGGSEKSSAGVGGLVKIPLDCTVEALGLFGFREEDFFSFSHCKSMETIYPRGVAKFDPRGMAGTIYVEDH